MLLPCPPTLTHLPKYTSNKDAREKKGTPTKGGPHPAAPSQKGCSISSSFTLIKARALSFLPFYPHCQGGCSGCVRSIRLHLHLIKKKTKQIRRLYLQTCFGFFRFFTRNQASKPSVFRSVVCPSNELPNRAATRDCELFKFK